MELKLDGNALSSVLQTGANVSKIVSNLTEKKSPDVKQTKNEETNSTNQPHNQTVEVKVGSEQKEQPVILKEKHETHVHKPYPDGRALSKDECEVEKMRISAAQIETREAREYNLEMEERARKERREREEYARQENERRREERKKRERRGAIMGSLFAAGCLGIAGYLIYSDYRESRAAGFSVQKQTKINPPRQKPIKVEGTVK